jgi:hypothetical protein
VYLVSGNSVRRYITKANDSHKTAHRAVQFLEQFAQDFDNLAKVELN